MNSIEHLAHQFLIAMPNLQDPTFHQTVMYICQHDASGAIGIIINRPMQSVKLKEIFEQIGITSNNTVANELPVLFGGPVQQERGFILHTTQGEWNSSLELADRISVTTSKDILEAIANDKGPEQVIIALGYAGWSAGQLENEIKENTWILAPVNKDIIFDLPFSERWQAAAALIGVDIRSISDATGHA